MVVHWGLTGDECSVLLGSGDASAVDEVSSYGSTIAERRMRLLVALAPIVAAVFDGDRHRTREWLRGPNSNLSFRTPLDVMMRSPEWIRWLINAMGVEA